MTREMVRKIDLRSDTTTKPTPAMREAMAQAEVGDDMFGDRPTVKELESTGVSTPREHQQAAPSRP